MTLDSASNFLACTILVCLGIACLALLAVFLNNLFFRYWNPITWNLYSFLGTKHYDFPHDTLNNTTNQKDQNGKSI
jgi:hypothetical protein